MKVLLTIHEMFYIIYEMIPKVSKAKGDYRIEQTAHLIRMRGLFLWEIHISVMFSMYSFYGRTTVADMYRSIVWWRNAIGECKSLEKS